jgi:hypothetical protein
VTNAHQPKCQPCAPAQPENIKQSSWVVILNLNVEILALTFVYLFNQFYIPFIWCAQKILYAMSLDTKMCVEMFH